MAKGAPAWLKRSSKLVGRLVSTCDATGKAEWRGASGNAAAQSVIPVLAELQAAQADHEPAPVDGGLPLEARIEHFEAWLRKAGVNPETWKFNIANIDGQGIGLVAKADIGERERVLSVPEPLFLSTETALKSSMGPTILESEFMKNFPIITLALHLLVERLRGPESPWAPYIALLPMDTFNALQFSVADFEALKEAPAMSESSAVLLQATIRHYSSLFWAIHDKNMIPELAKGGFTWKAFSWAVSIVSSRHLNIPVKSDNQRALALIPLWDCMNHEPGSVATDFEGDGDFVIASSLRAFPTGSQIFMSYGPRPNSELLLYSGFVQRNNPFDILVVTVKLPNPDALHKIRTMVLRNASIECISKLDDSGRAIPAPFEFQAHFNHTGEPDDRLLTLARVAVMTKEQLALALRSGVGSVELDDAAKTAMWQLLKGSLPATRSARAPQTRAAGAAAGAAESKSPEATASPGASRWVRIFLEEEAALYDRATAAVNAHAPATD